MSTEIPTRKARPVYRMARLDCGDLYEYARGFVIREGDTVFLAHVSHPADHRADYNVASLVPHRTNLSREETEHGDLGSDNVASYTAIGRGVVVTAPGPSVTDGEMYAVSETPDYLSGSRAFVEPYYSLRVRLDDSAPDTFEVVDLNSGSLYRPCLKLVRIDRAGE